jgi:hypothetical protein
MALLLLTYRFRINLTRRQHVIMGDILDQQRQLYNGALEESDRLLQEDRPVDLQRRAIPVPDADPQR